MATEGNPADQTRSQTTICVGGVQVLYIMVTFSFAEICRGEVI